MFVLAVTTSPNAWAKTKLVFNGVNCVETAIGLHPELLIRKINELDKLISGIRHAMFVGEIGIDGSPRLKKSLKLQNEVFDEVLKECERCGGRIISVHSRNAACDVLNLIEKNVIKSHVVLHWFSGSQYELDRAIELGLWFSINPTMINSRNGRNIISNIPLSRILPETDAPFTHQNGRVYMPWDTQIVINHLSKLHNISSLDIRSKIISNLKCVLKGIIL